MSENQMLETIGRKQLQLETQDAAYNELMNLFAGVLTGQIDSSRVLINLSDRTWTLAPEGQRPEMPATINGVPCCVVAPEKPNPLETISNALKAEAAPITQS